MADLYDTIELVADSQTIDDEVIDYEDTTDQGTQVIKTMNRRRRAIGFKDKTMEITFNLTVATLVSPKVNWREWQRTKKVFQLNLRPNKGGALEQLINCRVGRIQRTQSDGDGNYKVSCFALDRR